MDVDVSFKEHPTGTDLDVVWSKLCKSGGKMAFSMTSTSLLIWVLDESVKLARAKPFRVTTSGSPSLSTRDFVKVTPGGTFSPAAKPLTSEDATSTLAVACTLPLKMDDRNWLPTGMAGQN